MSTAVLSQNVSSSGGPAEEGFPWDPVAAPSVVESDTWLLSFIDVLSILLALFVLLLTQEHLRNKIPGTDLPVDPVEPVQRVYEVKPEPIPLIPVLKPFATIQLPALPQIVTPLSQLRIPVTGRVSDRAKKPREENVEIDDKPAPEILTETSVSTEDVEQTSNTAASVSPVNQLMETLRANGLASRIDIKSYTNSVHLDIADSILFAPARTTLSESGITLLGELAATLNTLPWSLSVEGHTDNIPIKTAQFPSNWELSAARASSVARELIRHGVKPERVRAIGYADTRPRSSNDTPEDRNRNRRVTFVLELPTLL